MSGTAALLDWLRARFDDDTLAILRHERLAGGAIQENVALDLALEGGARTEALVLRTDAASGVSVSHSREREHALLAAAFDAGVTVPEPLGLCTDPSVTGRPFFLMRRVDGSANPVRPTRDGALDDGARESLVRALGAELARIHAVPLDDARLAFLHAPAESGPARGDVAAGGDVLAARVARYRTLLDELGACRPVLEWALAWLARQRVAPQPTRLCHHDFRTGNLMIDDGRVTGVLDWEFAAPGDPHEDIGWFCAPCWRFAGPGREGGGLGSREAFYAGYEAAAGRTIDRGAVPVWEIVATLRWAVIALQQGARFTSGVEPTLELGLTGRMLAGLERDLLDLVTAAAGCALPRARDDVSSTVPDSPDGARLLAAARALLIDELLPALPGERRYAARMVANAMGIAERELGATGGAREGEARVDTTAGLGEILRAGGVEELLAPSLLARLRGEVEARLALDDPRRLRASAASPSG